MLQIMEKQYCLYYQARVDRQKTWFVVGVMRNEDHLAFERTLEGQREILEFFVPEDQEQPFLALMEMLKNNGCVFGWNKQPNRYAQGLAR